MAQYYVIRDKNTGLYFRGKGVNRWGKHYNQASIYRVKGMAENTVKEVSWRGEQAEIVPIQIIETTEDVVPKSEVEGWKSASEQLYKEMSERILEERKIERKLVARKIFEDIYKTMNTFYSRVQHSLVGMHGDSPETMRLLGKLEGIEYLGDGIAELKKKYTESEDKV